VYLKCVLGGVLTSFVYALEQSIYFVINIQIIFLKN